MHPTLAASKNFDVHDPGEPKDPPGRFENDKQSRLKQIVAQRRYFGKPTRNKRAVDEDEMELREYAVEQIVGQSWEVG